MKILVLFRIAKSAFFHISVPSGFQILLVPTVHGFDICDVSHDVVSCLVVK